MSNHLNPDPHIREHVVELLDQHGNDALAVAQQRMQNEMANGDVKAAGVWLSVMYELTRMDTQQAS